MKNFINIKGVTYKIPERKVKELKAFLQDQGLQEYNLEREYRSLICNLKSKTARHLRVSLNKIPEAHHQVVKALLVEQTAKDLEQALTPVRRAPEGSVSVPEALIPLAEYRTSTSSGSQVGRGELIIPLLFENACVNEGGNAVCDVTISGINWHVKNGKPQSGIRMGSAKKKLFSATEIYKELIFAGVEPTDFNELNQGLLKSSLHEWAILTAMDEKSLYERMSHQAVETSIGDAAGIIWYNDGLLTFTNKDSLSLDSTTQFRSKLSTRGFEKILGE